MRWPDPDYFTTALAIAILLLSIAVLVELVELRNELALIIERSQP